MKGIKPTPCAHESNFKKVGAIPSEPLFTFTIKFFYWLQGVTSYYIDICMIAIKYLILFLLLD